MLNHYLSDVENAKQPYINDSVGKFQWAPVNTGCILNVDISWDVEIVKNLAISLNLEISGNLNISQNYEISKI